MLKCISLLHFTRKSLNQSIQIAKIIIVDSILQFKFHGKTAAKLAGKIETKVIIVAGGGTNWACNKNPINKCWEEILQLEFISSYYAYTWWANPTERCGVPWLLSNYLIECANPSRTDVDTRLSCSNKLLHFRLNTGDDALDYGNNNKIGQRPFGQEPPAPQRTWLGEFDGTKTNKWKTCQVT